MPKVHKHAYTQTHAYACESVASRRIPSLKMPDDVILICQIDWQVRGSLGWVTISHLARLSFAPRVQPPRPNPSNRTSPIWVGGWIPVRIHPSVSERGVWWRVRGSFQSSERGWEKGHLLLTYKMRHDPKAWHVADRRPEKEEYNTEHEISS